MASLFCHCFVSQRLPSQAPGVCPTRSPPLDAVPGPSEGPLPGGAAAAPRPGWRFAPPDSSISSLQREQAEESWPEAAVWTEGIKISTRVGRAGKGDEGAKPICVHRVRDLGRAEARPAGPACSRGRRGTATGPAGPPPALRPSCGIPFHARADREHPAQPFPSWRIRGCP